MMKKTNSSFTEEIPVERANTALLENGANIAQVWNNQVQMKIKQSEGSHILRKNTPSNQLGSKTLYKPI